MRILRIIPQYSYEINLSFGTSSPGCPCSILTFIIRGLRLRLTHGYSRDISSGMSTFANATRMPTRLLLSLRLGLERAGLLRAGEGELTLEARLVKLRFLAAVDGGGCFVDRR